MLSSSEKNLCWLIAIGDEKEEDLDTPLTEEEKRLIAYNKKVIKYHQDNGTDFMLDAYDTDE